VQKWHASGNAKTPREGISVERPAWAPAELDLDRPNAARMYDYYLGGSHNFAVDRELAAKVLEAWPDMPRAAQANRAFLRRAVRFLAEQGIRQFLDIGSGIPTVGNVHEVAQRAVPDARVVYVDTDPVAVTHSRAILAGDDRTAVIEADGREPEALLTDPALTGLLDLSEPVGLLMVALLHFVPDGTDPHGILARYAAALAPGSWLVVSHGTADNTPAVSQMAAHYEHTATPLRPRNRDELTELLRDVDLVEPGVVFLPAWRPDHPDDVGDDVEWPGAYGAVGRLR
jgi:trans-aconitate methyltransferase